MLGEHVAHVDHKAVAQLGNCTSEVGRFLQRESTPHWLLGQAGNILTPGRYYGREQESPALASTVPVDNEGCIDGAAICQENRAVRRWKLHVASAGQDIKLLFKLPQRWGENKNLVALEIVQLKVVLAGNPISDASVHWAAPKRARLGVDMHINKKLAFEDVAERDAFIGISIHELAAVHGAAATPRA